MAKIIKTAKPKERNFRVGDLVSWTTSFHDGRSYEIFNHSGEIVKVCKVNLHVRDERGNTWEVDKGEVKSHIPNWDIADDALSI